MDGSFNGGWFTRFCEHPLAAVLITVLENLGARKASVFCVQRSRKLRLFTGLPDFRLAGPESD